MRNSTLVLPPQKPISELDLGSKNWAYFAMDDGATTTKTAVISNDGRANVLNDFAISGTLGTFWSDRLGFASPNGTAYAQSLLSANPGLANVCEMKGNTLLIGFTALINDSKDPTQYIMYMGGGSGGTSTGLQIRRTLNLDIIQGLFFDSSGTFVSTGTTKMGKKYSVSGITTGTTPTVTTTADHNLRVGDWVFLSNTNSTPVVDGMYQVVTVPTATTFTIATVNITAAATTGNVGPEWYVFCVIDGVNNEAQWHVIQKGTVDANSSTLLSLAALDATGLDFAGGINPNLTFFANRNTSNVLSTGQFRRFLFVNYGPKTATEAMPTLTSKLLPALANADLVPVWELEA